MALLIRLHDDGRRSEHPLCDGFVIGRHAGCDLVLDTHQVSRRHAEFRAADGGFTIADLGSTNGTEVAGRTITDTQPLNSGDRIVIGPATFEYQHAAAHKKSRRAASGASEEEAPPAKPATPASVGRIPKARSTPTPAPAPAPKAAPVAPPRSKDAPPPPPDRKTLETLARNPILTTTKPRGKHGMLTEDLAQRALGARMLVTTMLALVLGAATWGVYEGMVFLLGGDAPSGDIQDGQADIASVPCAQCERSLRFRPAVYEPLAEEKRILHCDRCNALLDLRKTFTGAWETRRHDAP